VRMAATVWITCGQLAEPEQNPLDWALTKCRGFMFRISDDSGFREVERKLNTLGARSSVSFAELFTPSFMSRHSRLSSFEQLIEAGDFKVESEQDFLRIPDSEWEAVVKRETSFPSWEAMQTTAANEWVQRQLDK